MIMNYIGNQITYQGTIYRIGDSVVAVQGSPYEGLHGTIFEIRDGEDKVLNTPGPDIYCEFMPPVNPADIARYEGLLTEANLHPVVLMDIASNLIAMAPEHLLVFADRWDCCKMKLYLVKSQWINSGEAGADLKVVMQYELAQHYFVRKVTQVILDFLPEWKRLGEIKVAVRDNYYECGIVDSYFENHIMVAIQEIEISIAPGFLQSVGKQYVDAQFRKHFAEQIESWEEIEQLCEVEIQEMIASPEVPDKIRKQLESNSCLTESYWESVSEAASVLVKDYIAKQAEAEMAAENGQ